MADTRNSPALAPYGLGAECFKRKDYEGAIRHFRAATEADSRFHRAWAYLAMSYSAAGRIDEAIDAYRKCIDIEPTYHKAYNNIGELYRRKGLLDYAAMVFKMATEIEPSQAQYFYNLGLTYADIGLLPKAEEALERAHRMDPKDFDYASDLAQIRFNLKKYDLSQEALEAFLNAVPGHDREPELKARLKMLRRRADLKEPEDEKPPAAGDRSTRIMPIEH